MTVYNINYLKLDNGYNFEFYTAHNFNPFDFIADFINTYNHINDLAIGYSFSCYHNKTIGTDSIKNAKKFGYYFTKQRATLNHPSKSNTPLVCSLHNFLINFSSKPNRQ